MRRYVLAEFDGVLCVIPIRRHNDPTIPNAGVATGRPMPLPDSWRAVLVCVIVGFSFFVCKNSGLPVPNYPPF